MADFIFNGPKDARWKIALAHGAGAGMDTPFMNAFAAGLAHAGLRVARFEFPYMASQRRTEAKRPPDREPVLRDAWLRAVATLGRENLVIGGKSMGGRIASLVADEAGVAGLVCLGYPFHPTGKPDQLRVAHLRSIQTPTLILQGTRDPNEISTLPSAVNTRSRTALGCSKRCAPNRSMAPAGNGSP
jgi:predicted alpha/beta-hydrolase family hydrolase